MASRCRIGIMLSVLLCVVVLAGCAKRPAMTAASAPAPSGAAASIRLRSLRPPGFVMGGSRLRASVRVAGCGVR